MSLSREQLVGLVRLTISCDGTEEEINKWVSILEQNVPDPNVSALIFYPDRPMTPEEIVDRAMSYKPILL